MRPQGEKPMAPMGPEAVGVQGEKPLPPLGGAPTLTGPPMPERFTPDMIASAGGGIGMRGEMGGGFTPGGLPFGGPNPPQFGGLPDGMTRGIPPELMQRIQALRGGGMSPMGGPVGMNGGGLQAPGAPPQMGGAAGPGIVGPGAVAQPTPQPPAYNPWGSGGGGGGPVGLDAFYRMAR